MNLLVHTLFNQILESQTKIQRFIGSYILTETELMTTEQYQKRLQFIELVKNNYIPIPGYQLIFYFEVYDISTIKAAQYSPTGSITRQYYSDRQNNECGGLVLTHDYDAHIIIHLFDKNCSIIYDITKNCIVENDLKMPLDMRQLKKELQQLYLVLKGQ